MEKAVIEKNVTSAVFSTLAKWEKTCWVRAFEIPAHVHLSSRDRHTLFGEKRDGRLHISTTKGVFPMKVAPHSVEISRLDISDTEKRRLGLSEEGGLLRGAAGEVTVSIVAPPQRHVHLSEEDLPLYGFFAGQRIFAKVESDGRTMIFANVLVKRSWGFSMELHLDVDESCASGLKQGQSVKLFSEPGGCTR